MTDLYRILAPWRGKTMGLIGIGKFGAEIRKTALELDMTVLIHDPPKEREQSEEDYEDILTQWGNGMGGCCTVREDPLVFLPLAQLQKRADLIVLAVPLNDSTENMIDGTFLAALKPGAEIRNFSDPRLIAPVEKKI